MRILFRCDEYPPVQAGGIGSVTKIVAEELIRKGHKVFVVGTYNYGHNLPYFSNINGVAVYRLTHFQYLKYVPSFAVKYIDALFRKINYLSKSAIKANANVEEFINSVVKREKIECIEIVDYTSLFKFFNREVTFNKFIAPTIMRVHGSLSFIDYYKGIENKVYIKNDINNFLRCDKICSVSKFSESFVNHKLNINKIESTVIYNPIEIDFLSKPKTSLSSNYILFIGKVTETKGAFSLLKAFNKISRKFPNLNLILLGGGEIEIAKSIVDEDCKNKVFFMGYIDRNQIKKYIDESMFCIIPTYFENFSMVALEVMARGKALIYSERTSGPEIINNYKDGLLVNPTNPEDIIEKAEKLLQDNDLRQSIERAAYLKIKNHFTINKIVIELESLYQEIINEKKNTNHQ